MTDAPFVMKDIPGKGKGLVAARPISAGELILSESPLITQTRPYTNDTILAALAALPDADQRAYFSLANVWKGSRLPPPLGIFKTNALPCGDNESGRGVAAHAGGVFLLGSRFNSSCEQNVNNYWNEDLHQITFWSVRDVAAGEELCISYSDDLASREDRRRRLEEAFRFVCACVACSREGAELKASDEHRVAIARLYDEIGACGNSPSVGVRKVKMALRLLAEENLLGSRGAAYYYDGFQFCASVSDVRNAKAWARKGREAYSVCRGANSEDAMRLGRYAEDPREHPAFGLLPKKTLVGPEA